MELYDTNQAITFSELLPYIITAIATLGTVIGILFKMFRVENQKRLAELTGSYNEQMTSLKESYEKQTAILIKGYDKLQEANATHTNDLINGLKKMLEENEARCKKQDDELNARLKEAEAKFENYKNIDKQQVFAVVDKIADRVDQNSKIVEKLTEAVTKLVSK